MKNLDQINVGGTVIDGDTISCTGNQLAIVLESLMDYVADCKWFVVDVFVPGIYVIHPYTSSNLNVQRPLLLGDTSNLIEFAKSVPQFEKGIFLCIAKKDIENLRWNTNVFDTENPDFIEPAELIIRAFDTTYFEIISKRKEVIKILTKKFKINKNGL